MGPFFILICLLGGAALYFLIPRKKSRKEIIKQAQIRTLEPKIKEISFFFSAGGSEIISPSGASLLELLQTWKDLENPITIQGWTDDYGTPAGNRKLSKDRAMEVKRFLENSGIGKNRILVSFHGTDPQSIGNKNKDLFRRVDCTLVPQKKSQ
ncbi:OmpA family protein [Leptospira haakeii]|uniref:OmpA-like domain-containing protein n=1 Tax=Leptospira haakeii TaxID=2023198 RepID=A0ABX4PNP3_9LEPT|nr:OmpA family protein [Leptospira haakeii]PKA16003.1 hypothetical protein CH363_10875 [Leptospira haakeii]PKA19210.1 hypothetical protein CH377_14210 [Leptospira haakeii]